MYNGTAIRHWLPCARTILGSQNDLVNSSISIHRHIPLIINTALWMNCLKINNHASSISLVNIIDHHKRIHTMENYTIVNECVTCILPLCMPHGGPFAMPSGNTTSKTESSSYSDITDQSYMTQWKLDWRTLSFTIIALIPFGFWLRRETTAYECTQCTDSLRIISLF